MDLLSTTLVLNNFYVTVIVNELKQHDNVIKIDIFNKCNRFSELDQIKGHIKDIIADIPANFSFP